MRIIALEEHFILPREEQNLPPGAHRGNDREKLLGFDVVGELFNLGDSRLAAMDAAGIDVQVLSHNQPGCQGLEADAAIPMAREVNDALFEAVTAHPTRFAGLAARGSRRRRKGARARRQQARLQGCDDQRSYPRQLSR
jgi:predicted TIM-barrel fold metal-dependent hydrolase